MQGRAELLVKGAFEGMMISKLRASYNHQVHVDYYLDQRHRWLHTCICYGIQLYEIKAENFHWKKNFTKPSYLCITVKIAIHVATWIFY